MRLLLLCLFLLSGCQSQKKESARFEGQMMTMHYRVLIGDPLASGERDRVQLAIDDVFFQTNQVFNRFNPNSEISRLNRMPAGKPMTVSDDLKDLLTLTDRMVRATEGRFNPAIWTVQEVWKRHLERGETPAPEEIASLEKPSQWTALHLDGNAVWKDHQETKLDLSGIAKGYTIDRLIQRLRKLGYRNVFVEWGGEIAAAGEHPEGRPWTIAVAPPNMRRPDHAVETIFLKGQGVATSGDYLQSWQVGDQSLTHIMDPKTGRPLKRCDRSVTVSAPSCAMADALATAGMVAESPAEIRSWVSDLEGVTCWFFGRGDSCETVSESRR